MQWRILKEDGKLYPQIKSGWWIFSGWDYLSIYNHNESRTSNLYASKYEDNERGIFLL